ncbi:MAG: AAA family ATPase [Clostridia bacterium]|nr:AAA family ATPase [Clostridia bacterium]
MRRAEIEEKLEELPRGGITVKRVKGGNGKYYEYHFLQWTEGGKQKSRRLRPEEIETVKAQLEERKKLELTLAVAGASQGSLGVHPTGKRHGSQAGSSNVYPTEYPRGRRTGGLTEYVAEREESYPAWHLPEEEAFGFRTEIRIGQRLKTFAVHSKKLKKREGFARLRDYLYGDEYNRVFILYGLRRTGKTTLIEQVIADMSDDDFKSAAYIQVTAKNSIADLNSDMKLLETNGYKYIFIDEVTMLQDFIEGAALLSDIYAAAGAKIVLSGTDSLGFWITKSNELYDRCRLLHTTFIPYREFAGVLGINGIDNYIRYGGTMSLGGTHYNEWVFADKKSTDEYIDSAIARNIQHSLKNYRYGGHFRHLYSLYEKNEMTGAINRIVEDMNHRFTIDVLEREFRSNDLRISANNLRKDRLGPTTILDDIDVDSFTKRLREFLEIKNKEERTVGIDEIHVAQIKEYLEALDLTAEIDVTDSEAAGPGRKRTVFTQPGLRYSQAKSFIESLSEDPLFKALGAEERKRVTERVLSEIKGRMAEDIILLETKLARPEYNVFKLQFPDGEFDMVIEDPRKTEIEIYEIKYSKERVADQARHLKDAKKCETAEFLYGKITGKTVLYRGENAEIDGILYRNIEDYLLAL